MKKWTCLFLGFPVRKHTFLGAKTYVSCKENIRFRIGKRKKERGLVRKMCLRFLIFLSGIVLPFQKTGRCGLRLRMHDSPSERWALPAFLPV